MKIGIITYHRSENFGAVLQAFALKKYLNNQGYNNVSFIDYWPTYHKEMYSLFNKTYFRKVGIIQKIKYLLYYIIYYKRKKNRKNNFARFNNQYIQPLSSVNDEYDIVIYGSDQIWRYQNHLSYQGYNSIYFGDNTISAKKKIAYSASIGTIKQSEQLDKILTLASTNLKKISVRERNLSLYLNKLNIQNEITLDPVFLLKKKDWLDLINHIKTSNKKYILVYNLQKNYLTNKIADYLSLKYNLPIFEVKGIVESIFERKNTFETVGPLNFLSLVRDATFVVTSSFHGVAFSILFEKSFFVSMNTNQDRVKNLLDIASLDKRYITDINQINESKDIDWDNIKGNINHEIRKSQEYILCNIKQNQTC